MHVAAVAFPPVEPVMSTVHRIQLTPLGVTDRLRQRTLASARREACSLLTHPLLRLALPGTLSWKDVFILQHPAKCPLLRTSLNPSTTGPFSPIMCCHSTWRLVLPISSQILLSILVRPFQDRRLLEGHILLVFMSSVFSAEQWHGDRCLINGY